MERIHHKVGLVDWEPPLRLSCGVKVCPEVSIQGANFMWKKPSYTEMRLGFEVTLYISNR
ncbi:pyrroloquinoline quinone precursor peptide PqqA [Enterovibrio paralichthyis]|uniref:pyrroloquinoline quinone precursor peptide PqqA n=1 Tax=Enterovibrio paralichthyis TaxID=2853805 RepID=UPI003AB9319C